MVRFEWIAIVAGSLLLAACGDRAPQQAAPALAQPEAAAKSGTTEASSEPATAGPAVAKPGIAEVPTVLAPDLSREATPAMPDAAIELKYQVATSPAVGQPVDIDFALVPQKASRAMRVMLATSAGLSLQHSSAPPVRRNVQAGAEYWHQLVVVPKSNGAFNLNIIASLEEGSQTRTRTFSIPVVVGSPPETQKPNPQVDANGQRVEVMPGQESR